MPRTDNRAALLRGARQCLAERGWAHTTVRDIGEAAGVSHAAIGYHFGSREALLTTALVAAVAELGERLPDPDAVGAPAWLERVQASFTEDRALWLTQLEAVVQAARSEEVRAALADGQREARDGVGGSVPLAVVVGLFVQSVVEPDMDLAPAEMAAVARLVDQARSSSTAR